MSTMMAPQMRLKRKRWKRVDYEKMMASGVLKDDDKLELIKGELFEKMTLNPRSDRQKTRDLLRRQRSSAAFSRVNA